MIDIVEAWNNFVKSENINRNAEWHIYCDVRDGLPLGTSEAKYKNVKVEKSEKTIRNAVNYQ